MVHVAISVFVRTSQTSVRYAIQQSEPSSFTPPPSPRTLIQFPSHPPYIPNCFYFTRSRFPVATMPSEEYALQTFGMCQAIFPQSSIERNDLLPGKHVLSSLHMFALGFTCELSLR